MSWGKMAPRRATILVTCCAQADDMSLDGSFKSKLIPAVNAKKKSTQLTFKNMDNCADSNCSHLVELTLILKSQKGLDQAN